MKRILLMVVFASVLFVGGAEAAVLSFSTSSRLPTIDELNDEPAIAGHEIYEFFVDTDSDILQIDNVVITEGPLFQHALGDDNSFPFPAFVAVFPSLGADSYINTPGGTAIAGGGFGDPDSAWFDTTNDGAQAGFKFAQLTIPSNPDPSHSWFSGRLWTQNSSGPEVVPFSLPIVPEPGALSLAGLGLLCGLAVRRRRRVASIRRKRVLLCSVLMVLFVWQSVITESLAAVLNLYSTVRIPTVDELNDDPGLTGYEIFEVFVTTDSDILQIDSVSITQGPLYQSGLGSDDDAPNPAFVAVFPALGADSYITTPGGTTIAGGGFGDSNATWFDTDQNGPQADFKFAQLTVPDRRLCWFGGRIQTQGVAGPEAFTFYICPEPGASVLTGLGLLTGLTHGRWRVIA